MYTYVGDGRGTLKGSVNISCFMKHTFRLTGVLLLFVMLMPYPAMASQFVGQDEYVLSRQESLLENLYVWAGRAGISGQVLGDLAAVGGDITTTGDVLNDMMAAGGSVTILGAIGDDLRVIGGRVTVGNEVGGDVVAAGGDIHILPDALILGDVYIAGGQVVIDGTVEGDVHLKGGRLAINGTVLGNVSAKVKEGIVLGPGALVGGELNYRAPREASIAADARVTGDIVYESLTSRGDKVAPNSGMFSGIGLLGGIINILAGVIFSLNLLAWLGFALLIVWLWRGRALELVNDLSGSFWRSLGQGLLVFMVSPLVIGLLLISFVGTYVGIAGIAVYGLLLIFSRALAGVVVGSWLQKRFKKNADWRVEPWWVVLGVAVLSVVDFVPFVGWLVSLVLSLALLGVLFRRKFHELHR